MDLIERSIFLKYMDIMIEVFPNLKSKMKIERIYWFLKDLPEIAIKEITTAILDNYKYTPTPNDFHEAAILWKKKNNFYQADIEIEKIECTRCNDLGIVRIQHHNPSDFDCLMNCACKRVIGFQLKAPAWSSDLLQAFRVSVCPVEWFKPKSTSKMDMEDLEVMSIMSRWSTRKQKAEKHWRDLGYEHEVLA